tara:strand:+ start:275 stop:622 length:348 start_codon:yes stop_codon:yes gene_type:complete
MFLAEVTASQGAIDNALWQYPVAALLVLVVVLFLRYLSKAEERNQDDRKQIHETFTTALHTDRQEMSGALDRMGERHQSISEAFTRTMSESTQHHSTMQAQIIDALSKVQASKDG